MAELIHVKGLALLSKRLDEIAAEIEKNIMRQALREGAKVIAEQAKVNAGSHRPSSKNRRLYGGYAGALRDSIRVGSGKVRRGVVTASVRAGGMKTKAGADVYYAKWVEYGTATHAITARLSNGKNAASRINRQAKKRRTALNISGNWVGPVVVHPGATKRPFMRPALEVKAGEAVVAAGNYIKKRLSTKHGMNTSEIEIEAD